MQLKPEQLAQHLQQHLAPIYLIHGDELLLVQEAVDVIRAAARARDYADREVLTVERDFDWNRLTEASNNLSLFAERRILEVRLPTGKPGDAGGKALRAYAARPAEDTLLLIISGKLDAQQRKSKWVTDLEAAGVGVPVWPVDARALPAWIRARMRAAGLQPTPAAVDLLAERIEGNLLACAQEIDKLALLVGEGPVDAAAVTAAVADSARFDVFGLVDSALAGEPGRSLRMLVGLRGEGVEPVLVVWALARELRSLAAMAWETAHGESPGQVMARHRVWKARQGPIGKALTRHRLDTWLDLLRRCAHLDQMVKGQAPGNVWDELVQLCLLLAGRPLPLAGEELGVRS
ncbi:MAG: DNA polymerase III subunit delta [Gammaproteobacteria bacterium]|nr:DNA polymerase III subunit delta [Gammaproteobacteria bacterium]